MKKICLLGICIIMIFTMCGCVRDEISGNYINKSVISDTPIVDCMDENRLGEIIDFKAEGYRNVVITLKEQKNGEWQLVRRKMEGIEGLTQGYVYICYDNNSFRIDTNKGEPIYFEESNKNASKISELHINWKAEKFKKSKKHRIYGVEKITRLKKENIMAIFTEDGEKLKGKDLNEKYDNALSKKKCKAYCITFKFRK